MSPELWAAIITSAIGGGLVGQVLNYLVMSRQTKHETELDLRKVSLDEFETLHQRCIQEVARLSDQVFDLEAMVVALSNEVLNLGGDPYAIRAAARRYRVPHERRTDGSTNKQQG